MKKHVSYAMLLAAGIFGFSSCNSPEMESRVEKLEQKVAFLEGNGGVPVQPTAVVNPAPNQLASVEEVKGPAASFQFEQEEYDFGTVKEGAVVEHTFKFKNVGDAPLIIQNASATCGCTVPSYSKEPIPVGGTGTIQVKFDSSNKTGAQNKVVTITANTKNPTTTVRIKGNVAGVPKDLSAGPVK